jgi:hypothetical protein
MRYLASLLALVCIPIGASSQSDTREAGDSRIAGRVLTESGDGIEGARVWAALFRTDAGAPTRYDTTTGRDGGYVVDRLPAGRYRLFAEKRGFTNMRVQPGRIDGGREVELGTGATLAGIDLVLQHTGSIAGRVTRPDGTPVAKARVMAAVRMANDRPVGTGPPTITDADGRYLVEDAPPGTYVVMATYTVLHELIGKAVPDEHQDWARTFHPATADIEDATRITIQGGARLENIDIVLQPEHRYRVAGSIVSEDGSPARNARLRYLSSRGTHGYENVSEDGRFTLGRMNGTLTLLASGETVKGPAIALLQLEVTNSFDNVQLTLRPPARVSGRVVFEGVNPPAQEIKVGFVPALNASVPRELLDTGAVGPDGSFRIDNLIGEHRVIVIGLLSQWEVKEVRQGGRVLQDARLSLASGDVVDDVEILCARRPP